MMDGEKEIGIAARALLPAIILTAALWFVNALGVRSSAFNAPLLACCYVAGFAILLYAEKGLGVAKTAGFYSAYIAFVLVGALLGTAVLRIPPLSAFTSFMLLPVAMFALPVAFELVMERVKSVQSE